MSVIMKGFSLPEMLMAMALSGILMSGALRLLPLLQAQNLRLQTRIHLQEELQQVVWLLEKAIQRAGYCAGKCQGEALQISGTIQPCLLLKWDENSNGQWEGPEHSESDWYGYRLRGQSLEMQRGVTGCDGSGWERVTDPQFMRIDILTMVRDKQMITLKLAGSALLFPGHSLTLTRRVPLRNLP